MAVSKKYECYSWNPKEKECIRQFQKKLLICKLRPWPVVFKEINDFLKSVFLQPYEKMGESGQFSGAQKKIGKWGYSETLSGNTYRKVASSNTSR